MATATVTLIPRYILTGNTRGRDSAPIDYQINGIPVGREATTGGFEYTGSRNPNDNLYTLRVAGRLISNNLTSGELESIIAALRPATAAITNEILRDVLNAGGTLVPTSTPAPVTTPAPVSTPTPAPAPTAPRPVTSPTPIVRVDPNDFIGTEAAPTPVTTPATVTTPTTSTTPTTTPTAISSPPTTTDPSQPDDIQLIDLALTDPGPLVVPELDLSVIDEISAEANRAVIAAASAFKPRADWRVRLALSDDPSVNYLYKAPNPGILKPLNATSGVIFPYTPTITVNYAANYSPTELTHSNYKVYQYSNSSIDQISIQCDFTAQDEYEANYLLAVIHFFRSATKMFYGQDQNPRRGTPPPLCYLYGMGSYQFSGQPLAISSFSYNLPNNVDYITTSVGGRNPSTAAATNPPDRTAGTGVAPGGVPLPPQFTPIAEPNTISWVPSKIQLQIGCVPMLSRNQVSNEFSFEKYATGELLNGVSKLPGAFW